MWQGLKSRVWVYERAIPRILTFLFSGLGQNCPDFAFNCVQMPHRCFAPGDYPAIWIRAQFNVCANNECEFWLQQLLWSWKCWQLRCVTLQLACCVAPMKCRNWYGSQICKKNLCQCKVWNWSFWLCLEGSVCVFKIRIWKASRIWELMWQLVILHTHWVLARAACLQCLFIWLAERRHKYIYTVSGLGLGLISIEHKNRHLCDGDGNDDDSLPLRSSEQCSWCFSLPHAYLFNFLNPHNNSMG